MDTKILDHWKLSISSLGRSFVPHFSAVTRLCIRSIATAAFIAAFVCPALAQDAKDQLFGVWFYKDPHFSSKLTIHPDGRFNKQDSGSGHQTVISGPIKVFQNPTTLRLIIQDYAPKQWCGPLGCKQIKMIPGETYRFKVAHNKLLLTDQNGHIWSYKRLH